MGYKIFDYKDIHTHIPGEDRVMSVDFTRPFPDIPPEQAITIGVHPWYADSNIDWISFEKALTDPRVVGIGEAGLDAVKGPALDVQIPVFEKQIVLSQKYNLPLIIHSVRNNHRILELKKFFKPVVPWIIHGFRGKPEEAKKLLNAGLHLSLGTLHNLEVARILHPNIHHETDLLF